MSCLVDCYAVLSFFEHPKMFCILDALYRLHNDSSLGPDVSTADNQVGLIAVCVLCFVVI